MNNNNIHTHTINSILEFQGRRGGGGGGGGSGTKAWEVSGMDFQREQWRELCLKSPICLLL